MNIPAHWPAAYPPAALRAEVEAMSAAWVEVLIAQLPSGSICGIYRKGSAQKQWDSPIDYVPELSDVDIHILVTPEAEPCFEDVDFAIEANNTVRDAYLTHVPAPLHFPKPQLVLANLLAAQPDILPSPPSTVTTMYGEPYQSSYITEVQRAAQRARSLQQLTAHVPALAALPGRIIDRLGAIRPLLGELNWRVSPAAPRILEVLGEPYEDVWSYNRTQLVAALRTHGLGAFADAYAAYYLRGWDAFLATRSAVAESATNLEVLRAAAQVIALAHDFAATQQGTTAPHAP